jgi:hypothetical protein
MKTQKVIKSETVKLSAENRAKLRAVTSKLSRKTGKEFVEWMVNEAVDAFCNTQPGLNDELAEFFKQQPKVRAAA